MSRHNVYRDGYVHVQSAMCSTCIFRPGNLMQLRRGQVRGMIEEARAEDSAIVCHQTLYTPANAVCRGFFEHHATPALRLAYALDRIRWVS
jgi:hypothetical protein